MKKRPTQESIVDAKLYKVIVVDNLIVNLYYDKDLLGFAFTSTSNDIIILGNLFEYLSLEEKDIIVEHEIGHILQNRKNKVYNTEIEYEYDADRHAANKFGNKKIISLIQKSISLFQEVGLFNDEQAILRIKKLQNEKELYVV